MTPNQLDPLFRIDFASHPIHKTVSIFIYAPPGESIDTAIEYLRETVEHPAQRQEAFHGINAEADQSARLLHLTARFLYQLSKIKTNPAP